ncbi:MAG: hypothetical protein FWG69_01500 [Oscillospiraceae bacterium]|nr:hypothetical protein [Oscillospiraceae bacterium]
MKRTSLRIILLSAILVLSGCVPANQTAAYKVHDTVSQTRENAKSFDIDVELMLRVNDEEEDRMTGNIKHTEGEDGGIRMVSLLDYSATGEKINLYFKDDILYSDYDDGDGEEIQKFREEAEFDWIYPMYGFTINFLKFDKNDIEEAQAEKTDETNKYTIKFKSGSVEKILKAAYSEVLAPASESDEEYSVVSGSVQLEMETDKQDVLKSYRVQFECEVEERFDSEDETDDEAIEGEDEGEGEEENEDEEETEAGETGEETITTKIAYDITIRINSYDNIRDLESEFPPDLEKYEDPPEFDLGDINFDELFGPEEE